MWNVKNLLVLTQEQLLNEINQWYPTGTSEQFLRMLDGEVQSITSMIGRANDLLSSEGILILMISHSVLVWVATKTSIFCCRLIQSNRKSN